MHMGVLMQVGKIPENILSKITAKILTALNYLHKEKHMVRRHGTQGQAPCNWAGVYWVGVDEAEHTAEGRECFGTIQYAALMMLLVHAGLRLRARVQALHLQPSLLGAPLCYPCRLLSYTCLPLLRRCIVTSSLPTSS